MSTGLPPKEQVEMMRRCSADIKDLRRQIAEFAPKAEAYDTIVALVRNLAPPPRMGMAEDIAWLLDKKAAEIEERLNGEKQAEEVQT